MLQRELKTPSRSFFLFGSRQTGKSTWLKALDLSPGWYVNLLLNDAYFRYLRDPAQFGREARKKIKQRVSWIIVDEIQRIPDLLKQVHDLLESSDVHFVLSGSSARKLKRSGGNMLGGFTRFLDLTAAYCGRYRFRSIFLSTDGF